MVADPLRRARRGSVGLADPVVAAMSERPFEDEDPRRRGVVDHTAWLGIAYAILGIAIGIALALR